MVENAKIPKRNAEQKRKELEDERKNWPTYKKPSYIGSYLILFLFLAIVGMGVYYALNHKVEVSRLWNRLTHPNQAPAQVEPGQ
jgi:hypothetical protein